MMMADTKIVRRVLLKHYWQIKGLNTSVWNLQCKEKAQLMIALQVAGKFEDIGTEEGTDRDVHQLPVMKVVTKS